MKFNVLSLHGTHYEDEVDFILSKSEQGEMVILKDHMPMMFHINEGYLELRQQQNKQFVFLNDATLEFSDNELTVVSYEAQIGSSIEEAKETLEKRVKARTEEAKLENIDFSKLEKDLFDVLKKAKAGKVS